LSSLAIIPARGGSKRILKKNIKMFFGKPIISYVIETIISTDIFDEVMVSTDDDEISKISKNHGATVPFFRSRSNANDFATLADVIFEVLEEYKRKGIRFDNICCILPTAALVSESRIIEAYKHFEKEGFSSVIPVIKFSYPIQRALKNEEKYLKMREPEYVNSRSQDLEETFHDSGQFYWLKYNDFITNREIFTDSTGYIELDVLESQDVDTMEDWSMLELKYKYKKKDNGYRSEIL
jgi:pseudaminic acid cytidylyltransferase